MKVTTTALFIGVGAILLAASAGAALAAINSASTSDSEHVSTPVVAAGVGDLQPSPLATDLPPITVPTLSTNPLPVAPIAHRDSTDRATPSDTPSQAHTRPDVTSSSTATAQAPATVSSDQAVALVSSQAGVAVASTSVASQTLNGQLVWAVTVTAANGAQVVGFVPQIGPQAQIVAWQLLKSAPPAPAAAAVGTPQTPVKSDHDNATGPQSTGDDRQSTVPGTNGGHRDDD